MNKETIDKLIARGRAYAGKILSLSNDNFEKTVVVALALCLVGAVLVSGAAVALKPLQDRNKAVDMKRNILEVAGLLEEGVDIDSAFEQIEIRLVDLETGEFTNALDPAGYDQRKAAKDPALSVAIPPDKDIADIKRRPKYAKIYLVKKAEQTDAIILPVSGYGLWSTMYGFLALEGDGQTVRGLNLYDQAETPGLGGEVVNPKWRAMWKGKKVYNDAGEPVLGLVKGPVDPSKPGAEFQVDALAGATLTSRGVSNLIRYWMGEEGFGPFLKKLQAQRG